MKATYELYRFILLFLNQIHQKHHEKTYFSFFISDFVLNQGTNQQLLVVQL
jgi:hypothetical protein